MTDAPIDRREFLKAAGAGGATLMAGCTNPGQSSSADTLVVATYSAFVDAPSTSPGAWVKQQFEKEFDAELVWQTPESELNYYIQRANADVEVDADVYVGLNVDHLIRLDNNLKQDRLFAEAPSAANASKIKQSLRFDPKGRVLPYDTGYICLVWNATAEGGDFEAPPTFDALTKDAYSEDLIAQNPSSSATGRAFLLHTIDQKGPDGYLDYWSKLQDNGVKVLGTWSDAYSAYGNGEAPMVVSYSTDQVYANRYDQNMQKHQLRFLNDEGYANPEGMAKFADTDAGGLADDFVSFMLRPEVQGQIAIKNVQFPAVTNAKFPEDSDYQKYAVAPPNAVTYTYQELKGNLDSWVSEWQKQIASN